MCGTDCGWMEVRSFLAQERRRCACACDAELHEWGVARHGDQVGKQGCRDILNMCGEIWWWVSRRVAPENFLHDL